MTVTAEIEYARSLVTSDEGIWMYVHDAQLIGTVYHTTGLVGDEGTPMEEWVKAVEEWVKTLEEWVKTVEEWVKTVEEWVKTVEERVKTVEECVKTAKE